MGNTSDKTAGGGDDGGAPDAHADGRCFDTVQGTRRDPIEPRPGDLMITEVMPAPTTGKNSAGEWFEARARASFDLNGLELGNEGRGLTVISDAHCLPVSAGDWLLFARSADAALNGGLPPVTAAFGFTLADAASAAAPARAVVIRSAGEEIARFDWTTSTKGISWQLSADAVDSSVNDPASWCLTPEETSYGSSRATPGLANVRCP